MGYDRTLANRIREALSGQENVREVMMFQAEKFDEAVERNGAEPKHQDVFRKAVK